MTNYKPTLQECAMRYGTGMGLLWAFKFMLFPLGLRIPFLQLLFIVLTIGVPFLGYIFAKKFRERHCDGSITFSRAFLFTTFMYMFASLFVAVVHLHLLPLYRWRIRIRGIPFHFKPVQRNCRSRTDNLTEPIRRSDRFTVGTYPAGNDISTDITKYVLRDANGHPYGIDRDA